MTATYSDPALTPPASRNGIGSRAALLLFLVCYGLACAVILLPKGYFMRSGQAAIVITSHDRH